MINCAKCKVAVHGSQTHCPLCHGPLVGAPCPGEDIFPVPAPDVRENKKKNVMAQLAVGSASAVILCVAINFMVSFGHWWALFVLGGVASFWVCWFLTAKNRTTMPRGMVGQIVGISALAVLWDVCTGFRGWSVDYVVPILIAFGVLALSVLSCAGVILGDGIVFYHFLMGLMGIVPVILLLTKTATLLIPSVICAAVCALSLVQTLGFEMPRLLPELKRRLHV